MNGTAGKVIGFDKKNPTSIISVVKYMAAHMILVSIAICFSYLTFHNFWVHTIWLLFLFSMAVHNGSVRYYKMMTSFYTKSLSKIMVKDKKQK